MSQSHPKMNTLAKIGVGVLSIIIFFLLYAFIVRILKFCNVLNYTQFDNSVFEFYLIFAAITNFFKLIFLVFCITLLFNYHKKYFYEHFINYNWNRLVKIGAWLQLAIIPKIIIIPIIYKLSRQDWLNSSEEVSEAANNYFDLLCLLSLIIHSSTFIIALIGYLLLFSALFYYRGKWFYRFFRGLNLTIISLFLCSFIYKFTLFISAHPLWLTLTSILLSVDLIYLTCCIFALIYLRKNRAKFID